MFITGLLLGTEIFDASLEAPQGMRNEYIYMYRKSYLLSLCNPPGRIERGIEQLSLGADDHPAVARKLEVRAARAQVDLAEELTGGVPDLDTVAAARVDIAVGVSVNTIRGARVDIGKGLPVDPGAVLEDVEAVAVGDSSG
jgi:hypothetical protein